MTTAKSFYQKKHGNEPFLSRIAIEDFAQEYYEMRMKEDFPTNTSHNYEVRRTQTVNLGVSKESKKEIY